MLTGTDLRGGDTLGILVMIPLDVLDNGGDSFVDPVRALLVELNGCLFLYWAL